MNIGVYNAGFTRLPKTMYYTERSLIVTKDLSSIAKMMTLMKMTTRLSREKYTEIPVKSGDFCLRSWYNKGYMSEGNK
jgi:hypothetical protein